MTEEEMLFRQRSKMVRVERAAQKKLRGVRGWTVSRVILDLAESPDYTAPHDFERQLQALLADGLEDWLKERLVRYLKDRDSQTLWRMASQHRILIDVFCEIGIGWPLPRRDALNTR